MSAFIVFHSTIQDPQAFGEYAQAVGPTLAAFDGQIMLRGRLVEVLAGEHAHTGIGVLSFPDAEAARRWYHSEAYQALLPLREKAATMSVRCYETPTGS